MKVVTVLECDVLAALRQMPSNSVDAVLSDPPYGLKFMAQRWDYKVPRAEVWAEVLRVAKPGAHLLACQGPRTAHRGIVQIEDGGWEIRDSIDWIYGSGFPKSLNLGDGHGTALKPAHEPIVLARKPVEGTIEQNVAKWGVGSLAIDDCRIATDWSDRPESWKRSGHSAKPGADKIAAPPGAGINCHEAGRWPANVLLDEEAAAILDTQSGITKTNGGGSRSNMGYRGASCERTVIARPGDTGGASRFFYVAKASRKERELGCELIPLKSAAEATHSGEGTARLNSPRTGAGRTNGARNHHPCVKPIALTTYLATLIRPKTPGLILVPYAGSGSEMIGAMRAGWPEIVGIEDKPDFCEIARARIEAWRRVAEAA